MSEYQTWSRNTERTRNKWHAVVEYYDVLEGYAFVDKAACGAHVNWSFISTLHEEQELPNGTLPTDASGVCLHCLRWTETENRKEEANG